ncbi:hypothetical protein MXB_834 [Myxobolus squamalis]|nr:hypothetical protein MXB_834 [Myxobolus squamalis]
MAGSVPLGSDKMAASSWFSWHKFVKLKLEAVGSALEETRDLHKRRVLARWYGVKESHRLLQEKQGGSKHQEDQGD